MEHLQDIQRISNYNKTQCLNDLSKLEDLRKVYYKVFGQHLIINCSNCIDDGIIRIQIELRKYQQKLLKIMKTQDALFVLKPGTVIDLTYSTGGYITENNITDDIARELVRKNQAYLRFFDKYPVDVLKKEAKVPEAKVPEAKVPEAKVPEAKVPEEKVPEEKKIEERKDIPAPKPSKLDLLKKTKVELTELAGLPVTTNKSKIEIVDVILSK